MLITPKQKKSLLLFSGSNPRAIITLCRFLTRFSVQFSIVSSGHDDAIYQTAYKSKVRLERQDRTLSIELFKNVAKVCEGPLVYCPTSEFLNTFVLDNRADLEAIGIESGLPSKQSYCVLTGKRSSQAVFASLPNTRIPTEYDVASAVAPCVLKPKRNVVLDRVLYPILCKDHNELQFALNFVDRTNYFAQQFIEGKSYYICGYISRSGKWVCYWQENLIQQPDGKSMVFARSCTNPGLDESAFFLAVASTGYHGPIMSEFIRSGDTLYYIETNPRFWGPLELSTRVCPSLLSLYLLETLDVPIDVTSTEMAANEGPAYYAWYFGMNSNPLKVYPGLNAETNVRAKIEKYDVYNHIDTSELHKRY